MDFAKMALFKSYAVIYLAISAAIIFYMQYCLYSTHIRMPDDTETVDSDRPIHIVILLHVR